MNGSELMPKMVSLDEFAGSSDPKSPEVLKDYTNYLAIQRARIANSIYLSPSALHEIWPLPNTKDVTECIDILRPAIRGGIDAIFDHLSTPEAHSTGNF